MSKYPEKRRRGLNVPWGYEEHPDDPNRFIPIDDMLDAYYEALDAVKRGCSWRQVSKWLSMETGVPITTGGLYLKAKQERQEKEFARRSAVSKRMWKERFAQQHSATDSEKEESGSTQ